MLSSGLHSRVKKTALDEGDGDLGLQGMHMETTPPRSHKTLDSPTERGHTLQIIKSRFGSQSIGKGSASSFGSSYFSAKEEDSALKSGDSPSSPGLSPGLGTMMTTTTTPEIPPPRSRTNSAKSSSSKGKSRFSKLRADIAGSPSQRPLAGSSNGVSLSPRVASTAATKAKIRPTSSGNGKRRSSGIGGGTTGDLSSSSPRTDTFSLTSGTSSTGLLVGSPVLSSMNSLSGETSSSKSAATLAIPGRRTSLVPEKNKTKNREGGKGVMSMNTSELMDADSSTEENLQRWVLSVGCVNFDLDKGPDLEFLYPSLGISREERDNIAFSSFPDTSIFDDGQVVFSWRVREVPLDSSGSEAPLIATPHQQQQQQQQTNASPSSSKHSVSKITTAGHSRASMLPGKESPTQLSSSSHKLWSFDRGWKQPIRSLSSDSAVLASHSSSRSGSPLVSNNTLDQLPPTSSSPSPEYRNKLSSSVDSKLVSNETQSSLTSASEDARTTSNTAVNSIESTTNAPQSSSTLIDSIKSTTTTTTIAASGETPPGTLRPIGNSRSSNFIHGYCFFRQRRDASIRRGYFQKSVVILSHLPYVSLFSEIVKKLGPLYFQNGMPALEAFRQDVQNWPPPEPGARMHLPLLGSVLSVDLPFHSQFQTSLSAEARIVQNTNTTGKARSGLNIRAPPMTTDNSSSSLLRGGVNKGSGEEPILASIPSTPLFEVFRESLDHLWLLWECLLLADPILVVGPDPKICSEAVWHLIDLIRPIPFAGDFRPFFTIHDYDFQTLVTKNKPSAGVILGVTNPFMLQVCKHWPHVFKVGKAAVKMSAKMVNRKNASSSSQGSLTGQSGGSISGGGGIAGGNSAGGGGPEHVPGLLSKRKRRISKDRPLLRKLIEMAEKGTDDEAANAMLRRYFSDLTEMFLAPLNRYVSSLIPAEFDLSSPSETPRIKPFNSTAFLASLKAHGTPLPIRSRNLPTGAAVRQSLYHEFIQCPNFSLWLHDRVAQAEEEQYNRKLRALESGNIDDFVSRKSELETIDLYSRLKMEIDQIDARLIKSKREREVEPNSRWKSPSSTISSASATLDKEKDKDKNSTSSLRRVPVVPALALSMEPPNLVTAQKIEEQIRTSGNTLTTGENSLLLKKIHLIEQLEKLVKNLPSDLRDSLALKEGRGRQ